MKNATIIKMQTLVLVATLAAYAPATFAEKGKPAGGTKPQTAATTPDAAAKSPCGNQTFCYDTPDFIATVTQFRTSTDGSGNKMLDAIVHFQNKTDQVLSLGYADGSAESLDDHGNRYELNKDRGVRGMGVIAGTTPDAKFVLQPNGAGDAHFELMWNPKDQIAGATYELELSVREMSRGDDKQWALGNEILVHYDGLANGSASASGSPAGTTGGTAAGSEDAAKASAGPAAGSSSAGSAFMSNLSNGATAASQPCGTATAKAAGAAGSTGQSGAASAVTNTSAAITSISSLFGHKAAAAPAAANSASAAPCAAATNVAGGAGSTAATKGNKTTQAAAPAQVAAAPAAPAPAAPARTVTKPAPARQTGVVNALLKQPVAPAATPKAPAPVAKPLPPAKKPTPAATATATAGGQ
jgi:hypothetical protein